MNGKRTCRYNCSFRLSYYERIKKAIPEGLHDLLPTEPQPFAKFEKLKSGKASNVSLYTLKKSHLFAESSLSLIVSETISAMRNKQPFDQIQTIIERIRQDAYLDSKQILGEDIIATNLTQFKEEVFVYSVLLVGAKSFSHVLNAIERYTFS